MAKSYLALEKDKKSKKLYEKLLKKHSNDEDLLVSSLKLFPQRADEYLPTVASVDISNNEKNQINEWFSNQKNIKKKNC